MKKQQVCAHPFPVCGQPSASDHAAAVLLVWLQRCERTTARHMVLMTVLSRIPSAVLDVCGQVIKNFGKAESQEGSILLVSEGVLISTRDGFVILIGNSGVGGSYLSSGQLHSTAAN